MDSGEGWHPPLMENLTKREWFAGMALQGIIMHPQGKAGNWEEAAKDAFLAANAMIAESKKG